MSRPNIVVIMADQLAPQFTGAYGHPIAKTPHLDALAERGMRFDAAYCNSPLCATQHIKRGTGVAFRKATRTGSPRSVMDRRVPFVAKAVAAS